MIWRRSIIIAFCCILMPVVVAMADSIKTESEFTEILARKIESSMPGYKVQKIEDSHILVTSAECDSADVFLQNDYKKYANDTSLLDSVIDFHIKAAKAYFEKSYDKLGIKNILPIVRDKNYIDVMYQMYGSDETDKIIKEKINEELYKLYALDDSVMFVIISRPQLDKLGISQKQLADTAIFNLYNKVTRIELRDLGGIYAPVLDYNYESSIILLDKLWTKDMFPVDGDFVMIVPARDLLYVTGSNNKDGIKKLQAMQSENFDKLTNQISDKIFIRKNNRWELFKD